MNLFREHFRGVIVPLLTPFTPEFQIDPSGYKNLLDSILKTGIRGLLVGGTTGEAASMTEHQVIELVRLTREYSGEEGVVFAGIGGNCLEHVLTRAQAALEAGADAVVAHSPYYYPLFQAELEAWYRRIADAVEGPLLIYNIPQTTDHSIDIEVIERLSHHPQIVGVKDSEFDEKRLEKLIRTFQGRDDFQVYTGPTVFAARAIELGACGFIPSLGNVLPEEMHQIFLQADAENYAEANNVQKRASELNDIYQKGQPAGYAIADLKTLLNIMGICGPTMMPPLTAPSEERRRELEEKATEFRLITT